MRTKLQAETPYQPPRFMVLRVRTTNKLADAKPASDSCDYVFAPKDYVKEDGTVHSVVGLEEDFRVFIGDTLNLDNKNYIVSFDSTPQGPETLRLQHPLFLTWICESLACCMKEQSFKNLTEACPGQWEHTTVLGAFTIVADINVDVPGRPVPKKHNAPGNYMDALRSDQLVGSVKEGLNNIPVHRRIPRHDTCTSIVVRCTLFGFQLIRAPPRSGRTSILQLLAIMVKQKQLGQFAEATYINMASLRDQDWVDFFRANTEGNKSWAVYSRISGEHAVLVCGGTTDGNMPMKLLLLDEMQSSYGKAGHIKPLLEYMKCIAGGNRGLTRIVMASVHGDSPSMEAQGNNISCTPFQYTAEHIVGLLAISPDAQDNSSAAAATAAAAKAMLQATINGDETTCSTEIKVLGVSAPGVGFTWEEAEALWSSFWAQEMEKGHIDKLFTMAAPSVMEHLYWVTSGQVGIMSCILGEVRETVNDNTKRQWGVGLGDEVYLRLFRSGDVYRALSSQRGFITNAFACGEPCKQLLDKLLNTDPVEGCLVEGLCQEQFDGLQLLKNQGLLCVQDGVYRFWTPLHHMYYRHMVFTARLASIKQPSQPSSSLVEFLKVCMSRMSATQLRLTLSRCRGEFALLERALQMEFYRVSFDLVPVNGRIDADVNKGPGNGWVDFWVQGAEWAVELLCDGINMAEHERRFQKGGKYVAYPMKEYALLDFRGPNGPRPSKLRDDNTYHVLLARIMQQRHASRAARSRRCSRLSYAMPQIPMRASLERNERGADQQL